MIYCLYSEVGREHTGPYDSLKAALADAVTAELPKIIVREAVTVTADRLTPSAVELLERGHEILLDLYTDADPPDVSRDAVDALQRKLDAVWALWVREYGLEIPIFEPGGTVVETTLAGARALLVLFDGVAS